jgi:hypothetical protein
MSILKFATGRPGTGKANIRYILRERACALFGVINLDQPVERERLTAYAECEEGLELLRPQRGNGKARTHYRMILSWERQESPGAALNFACLFIQQQFPTARAVLAVHTDTANLHIHAYLPARGTDGKKLRVANYHQLDHLWAKAYDKHYGTTYARLYLERKRDPNHRRPPQWKVQRAYDQRRTDDRKRSLVGTVERPTGVDRLLGAGELAAAEARAAAERLSEKVIRLGAEHEYVPDYSIAEKGRAK